jgi:hypothetical protein
MDRNKKIRYQFDRIAATVGIILLTVGLGSAILGHPGGPHITDPFVLFLALFWVLVVCDLFFGSYAELDEINQSLSRVNGFVWKKSLGFDQIKELKYQPTWKVGTANHSLYVIGVNNGQEKIIDFPNLGFAERTIAKIARDLKSAIPTLHTDSHTDTLISKYYKHAE